MSRTVARLRSPGPILLSYLGLLVLFVLVSVYSPGFADPNHVTTLLIVAAFTGIVGHRPDVVIIGGGIDLSVPWMLNCAAVLVTALARGQDGAADLDHPAHPRRWRAGRGRQRGRHRDPPGAAHRHDAVHERRAPGRCCSSPRAASRRRRARGAAVGSATGRLGPVPGDAARLGRARGRHPRRRAAHRVRALPLRGRARTGRSRRSRASRWRARRSRPTPSAARPLPSPGILLAGYARQSYLGMGDPYLFTSIAAVAIGGASILGGTGSYLGTIAGALMLTVLTGLLPILRLDSGRAQGHLRRGHPGHRRRSPAPQRLLGACSHADAAASGRVSLSAMRVHVHDRPAAHRERHRADRRVASWPCSGDMGEMTDRHDARRPFDYSGERGREVSFPLGGIGTGCIGLSGGGRLVDWEILNRPDQGHHQRHHPFRRPGRAGRHRSSTRASSTARTSATGPATSRPTRRAISASARAATRSPACRTSRRNTFEGRFPIAELDFDRRALPGRRSS